MAANRNTVAEVLADPPAGNIDWPKEVRERAERSRYGLPPFMTPTYEELRHARKENPESRRLSLEDQTGRYALLELEAMMAEAYWYLSKDTATIAEARKSLGRIRRRLIQEKQRIGPITGDGK